MISLHETEKLSLPRIEGFLGAGPGQEVRFEASARNQVYSWFERLLCQQEYMRQGRRVRGLLRCYLGKMTGLSRAQVTRLVACYVASGQVRVQNSRRHRFQQRYTRADIELLAQGDEAHQNLSGPATRRILEREFREYGERRRPDPQGRPGYLPVDTAAHIRNEWNPPERFSFGFAPATKSWRPLFVLIRMGYWIESNSTTRCQMRAKKCKTE